MFLKIALISFLVNSVKCLDLNSFYNYVQNNDNTSSVECMEQKAAFLQGLINGDAWAVRMLDASGRLPKGLSQGNTIDIGMFDQCLDIMEKLNSTDIKGKYCYLGLVIPLSSLKPNTSMVIENIKKRLTGPIQYNVASLKDDTSNILESTLLLSACIPDACNPVDIYGRLGNNLACQTKNETKKLQNSDIAFLCFLAIIACLIIGSTGYDIYLHKKSKEAKFQILLAFSFYTNGQKIFKTTKQSEQILVFNGLKVLSLFWVMLGHSYGNTELRVVNLQEATSWRRKWYAIYALLSPLAVDTFLFISGTLLAYVFLKTMRKPNQKFNILLYYLHRYLRLAPAMAVLYFFQVTVAWKIYDGPSQPLLSKRDEENCLNSNWWAFFLYVQNYVIDYDKMCLLHTWYLSVDMQLYIISPLLLLPILYYGKRITYLVLPILALMSVTSNMLIIYFYDIVLWTYNYHKIFYYATHTRLPPWFIGLIFGAFLVDYQTNKRKYQLKNKLIVLAIWGVVLCVLGFIFFYEDDAEYNHTKIKATFFYPLQKLLWALCLCWISYACISGNGGFLNTFLSAPFFQVLSKVTYSTYLIHLPIQLLYIGHSRTMPYFTDINGIREVLADFCICYLAGILWTLAFESPIIVLERVLFREVGSKKETEKAKFYSNGNQATR